ncbi:MAG: hypothetical protein WED87_02735, partial [Dehalococcoidia bacterium]
EDNIHIVNNLATPGTVTIGGGACVVSDNSTATGGNGVNLNALGTADLIASVDGCSVAGNRLIGVRADAASTATLSVAVTGSTVVAGSGQGNQGIEVSAGGSATVTFDISNNDVGTGGAPLATTGINVFGSGGAGLSMTGTVLDNTVVNAGGSGIGVRVFQFGGSTVVANVSGNSVSNVGLDFGILADAGGATAPGTGALHIRVTNNSVSVLGGALDAIRVQSRNSNRVCSVISGNTTNTGGAGFFGLFVRQAAASLFEVEGLALGPQPSATAISFLMTNNPGAASVGGTGTFTGVAPGACLEAD